MATDNVPMNVQPGTLYALGVHQMHLLLGVEGATVTAVMRGTKRNESPIILCPAGAPMVQRRRSWDVSDQELAGIVEPVVAQ